MKKYLILLGIAITVACSNKEMPPVEEPPVEEPLIEKFAGEWEAIRAKYSVPCDAAVDAFLHPEDWSTSYMIPAETISVMGTCELLSSYFNYQKTLSGPWCFICGRQDIPGFTLFNRFIYGFGIPVYFIPAIELEPTIVEFFSRNRDDCANALASTYLWLIDHTVLGQKTGKEACLELMIASDMSMTVLDENTKKEFMLMALMMADKFPEQARETRHIMVSVMKSENYTPFLTEAELEKYVVTEGHYESGLTEWLCGYIICRYNVVEKFARQYLTEKLENNENE
jgi:hypothetical protein